MTSDSASMSLMPLDDEDDEEELERAVMYAINPSISEESSESYDNDTHIASWIEGSLINSSIYSNKEDEAVEDSSSDAS